MFLLYILLIKYIKRKQFPKTHRYYDKYDVYVEMMTTLQGILVGFSSAFLYL